MREFARPIILAALVPWALVLGLGIQPSSVAFAQQTPMHYFHSADLPPGTVGRGQLLRGGPLPGYFQPVEVRVPEGARVSVAVGDEFSQPAPNVLSAGMLIGGVYRLKVTNIPGEPGQEVYPTIELTNRLHPPPGQETRFPIPIDITAEELEMAISGRFVTRIVYLEDPSNPLPIAETPQQQQRYFEVKPDQDPLLVADQLGRPMAILRMGSRVPDQTSESTNLGFSYGCPPVRFFERPIDVPRGSGLEELHAPPSNVKPNAALPRRPFPRLPLPSEQEPSIHATQPRVQR